MKDAEYYRTLLIRLIVSEILIVLLLVGSGVVYQALYAQKPEVQEAEVSQALLNVDVFQVDRANFRELLTAFGTAEAEREVVLAAQVSGEIIEIHPSLKVGAAVRSGEILVFPDRPSEQRDADTLLRIDPRDYQQRVDSADSRIAEAEKEINQLDQQLANTNRQLAKAREDLNTFQEEFDRVQTAFNRGAATPSALNRAVLDLRRYEDTIIQLESQQSVIPLQIDAAKQRIATAQTERRTAANDLKRTEVQPPFSGVLTEVSVEQGQFVRTGEPLVRLTDLQTIEIPVSMRIQDFLLIEENIQQKQYPRATLAADEQADAQWTGAVVRSAQEADPDARTIDVFVEVVNEDDSSGQWLLPGIFAHARIDGPTYNDAILIPREALVEGHVFVVDEAGVAHRRQIVTGRRMQSLIVVEDGLQTGDRVVLTNLDIVEDGRQVEVQQQTTVAEEIQALRAPVVELITTISDTEAVDHISD